VLQPLGRHLAAMREAEAGGHGRGFGCRARAAQKAARKAEKAEKAEKAAASRPGGHTP
jgi:hypothetical protein